MAKKEKNYDLNALNGISIYHENKRTVYAPFYSKKAYIINENNVSHYNTYIQGYLIAIVIFLLAQIFYRHLWVSLLLALLFMVSTFIIFKRNFLDKAAVIEDYKKPQRDNFITRQARLEKKNIRTIIICSPLLAAAILFNSYLNKVEGDMLYLMIFIAIIAVLYGLLHIYILLYKNRNSL
ncbi:MAG: hypothetical protein IJI46_07420 [Erysipelotrichaceae bacterium]|nr:hypothetical protein [Erysipelotrichaceae bacterium]